MLLKFMVEYQGKVKQLLNAGLKFSNKTDIKAQILAIVVNKDFLDDQKIKLLAHVSKELKFTSAVDFEKLIEYSMDNLEDNLDFWNEENIELFIYS